MIHYRFNEEKEYALYYANALSRDSVVKILQRGYVESKEEAQILSSFFWEMVDKSIENEKNGVQLPWPEGAEYWNETLLHTFSGHLESSGYIEIWDQEVDRQ